MKDKKFSELSREEMRKTEGGEGPYHAYTSSKSLIDYSWLQTAAAKLRANLQVAPPVVPPRPF